MTGTKLINSVISKFTKLTDRLEEGIKLVKEEQLANDNTISALEARNEDLQVSKNTAENLASNLRSLLT